MRAANIFYGILLLVLFALMRVPSFTVGQYGINVDVPNPLYLIFNSWSFFTIPVLNIGITLADVIGAVAVIMLVSGVLPSTPAKEKTKP